MKQKLEAEPKVVETATGINTGHSTSSKKKNFFFYNNEYTQIK